MCVEITSRERPWAAPPLSSKARMKAVGTNPLARYVGQETGARPPPTPAAQPPNTHTQPAGEPGEPITHDHNQETKPLDFVPIGWSFRPLTATCRARAVERGPPHRRVGAAAPSNGGSRPVEPGPPHRRVGAAAPSSGAAARYG